MTPKSRIDYGDILILVGAALFIYGLFLIDPRIALVFGGVLLMVTGFFRLTAVSDSRNKSGVE